jgi:hypothetical protein
MARIVLFIASSLKNAGSNLSLLKVQILGSYPGNK